MEIKKQKIKIVDKVKFKEKYYSVGKIHSPALNTEISFNGKGLNHLYYADNRSDRKKPDIAIRQHLFDRAIRLLRESNTLTGKHTVVKNKNTTYFELIGLIDYRRIKVILRKEGNGVIHFWSVIPSWKYCKNGSFFNMSGKILE